ncbi:hypothetical protein [Proteiniphilum acetatigenes]|uniref:hypothetical protein n=1 Tax=Proteiniphilum acetatigenes TaxID=294710 RepID=UPI00036EE3C0|nr:hypothetical protein [Proteiniphilum acetatigenes]
MANPDTYFNRKEVSNSDLTELKNLLYPRTQYGDKEKAFKFGTLIDAIITEPDRVDFYKLTVDDVLYLKEDFDLAIEMRKSLIAESRKDTFLANVLKHASTQTVSIRQNQPFDYCGFEFTLDTRCKWDFWLSSVNFGGDLKSTFAESQKQFEEAIDFFDWDRSRAWYMDIIGSDRDFIYAISKKNCKVFKYFIQRGDKTYEKGKEKYLDLAFKYWQLIV